MIYKILWIVIVSSCLTSCSPALIHIADLPPIPKQECIPYVPPKPFEATITLRRKDGKLLEADEGAKLLIQEYTRVMRYNPSPGKLQ